MTFAHAIAERSVILFGLVLFLVQLACFEFGHRIGRRRRERTSGHTESVGLVVGGMLGLLAFVLALTLSFANTRFNDRQAGTLAEANAIGTAWLRAKAIGGPRAETIATLLEQYTPVRADFVRADPEQVEALAQRTNALQSEMWGHLAALVREKPDPVSSALMAALNDAFDASTKERFAYFLHVPPQMFWLLVVMAVVSIACLGYQLGLRDNAPRVLIVVLTLMWTVVIVNILDLASARIGYLRAGTAAYEWTLQGFKGGLTIPALR